MKKTVIIVVSGILLGLLGAGGYFYYLNLKEEVTPTDTVATSPEKIEIEYATWKDHLGVSFSYPKDAVVNKHDEDKENYMHVEITSATYSGGLVFWARDIPKKEASISGVIVDTTLGGVVAKKILVNTKQIVLSASYDGLLFEIEGNLDNQGYWQEALDKAISSYVFYSVEGSSPGSAGGFGSGGGIDEEEVLE